MASLDRPPIQAQAGMIKTSFLPVRGQAAGAEQGGPEPPVPSVRRGAGLSRPITLLIVGAVVLIAAVARGTAAMILNLRSRALTDNERELRNVALVVAAQVDRIFDGAERVEKNLVHYFAELGVTT